MALMNCPECGREVSDQAVSCPGCGYVVASNAESRARVDTAIKQDEQKKRGGKIAFAIIAVVLVFAVGFGLWYVPWGDEGEAINCAQELKDRMKAPDSFTLKSAGVSYFGAKQIYKFTYSAQNSYGAALTEIYYAGDGERVTSQDDMGEMYSDGEQSNLNAAKISMHLK